MPLCGILPNMDWAPRAQPAQRRKTLSSLAIGKPMIGGWRSLGLWIAGLLLNWSKGAIRLRGYPNLTLSLKAGATPRDSGHFQR